MVSVETETAPTDGAGMAETSPGRRSRAVTAWLAWSLSGVSLALIGAALLIPAIGRPSARYDDMILAVGVAGAPVLGALLAWRRPKNRYGWMWLFFGFAFSLLVFTSTYARRAVETGELPAAGEVAALSSLAWAPWIAFLPLLLLLFPDGRVPSPRWRFVLWAVVAAAVVGMLLGPFMPGETGFAPIDNPWGVEGTAGQAITGLITAGVMVIFVCVLLAVASLVFRYRRAEGVERQQIKWFAYAAVLFGAFIVFAGFLGQALPGIWDALLETAAVGGLYAGVGIAVFRYRLYDIDPIINRTLVYGLLTATVVAVYAVTVASLGALFQDENNFLVSLIAAALVAVLFSPAREWLQRNVDRLTYGERHDPYGALSRLARRLEQTLVPEAVLPAIVEDVAEAIHSPWVGIWVADEDSLRLGAAHGTIPETTALRDADAAERLRGAPEGLKLVELGTASDFGRVMADRGVDRLFPLVHQGKFVGAITLAPRSPGEEFSALDRRLLRDLATQAGAAAHAVGLTVALRGSLEELHRSRERLVQAQNEERRRIQRDLHDGLGPMLASMRLRLEACLDAVHESDPSLAGDLERVHKLVGDASADIRRLVHDLRPPILDRLGLVSGIRLHCEQFGRDAGLAVGVEADDDLVVPEAAEATLLRVAQEALHNVGKHAQATRAEVRLQRGDGWISLEVSDDGIGFDPEARAGTGTGIGSMRERADLLGGTLHVASENGEGTRVILRVPVRKEGR